MDIKDNIFESSQGERDDGKLLRDHLSSGGRYDMTMGRADKKENLTLGFFGGLSEHIKHTAEHQYPLALTLFDFLFSINTANSVNYNVKNLEVKVISFQKDILSHNNQIKNKILDVLVDYFNQRYNLLKELMQVELIHGNDENRLFES